VITTLIKRIARQLDASGIAYMIIGGQAVLLYGRPRLTRDIDITLGVDTDQFAQVAQVCKDVGIELLPEDPSDFATKTNVLPAEEPQSKIRVDFIFSFTPYEAQAIERGNEVLLEDCTVRFATCEDVIIHKMVAARPIDHEDVRHAPSITKTCDTCWPRTATPSISTISSNGCQNSLIFRDTKEFSKISRRSGTSRAL